MSSTPPRPGRIRPAPDATHAPVSPSRRGFLARGGAAVAAGGVAALASAPSRADDALPPSVAPWSRALGAPVLASPYGVPSKFEANVRRRESPGLTRTPQSSVSFTPLQNLFGIITPSGLHFERHHAGMPEIDPHRHRLMIHGMVREPRIYTMDDIVRFPSVSRIHFIECGANTGMEWAQRRRADRAVLARHARLQRVDRRPARHAARGSGRRPEGEVRARRRRGRRGAHALDPDGDGARGRARLLRPERRDAAARSRAIRCASWCRACRACRA